MIYLISGASRSGKSMLAKEFSKKSGIPFLPLDSIMMAFMNGLPEYGIKHTLWPDDIANRLWPFLKAFIEDLLHNKIDYIIEGEAMLPNLLAPLYEEHKNELMIRFLGYTESTVEAKREECLTHSTGKEDWILFLEDEELTTHVENMIGYSHKIKNLCDEHNMEYIDTSKDFQKTLDKVLQNLLKKAR